MRQVIDSTRWGAFLAIVGLAACAGGEQGGETAMSTMGGEAAADTAALAPKNDSGIMGSVVLTEHGDSVTVAVMIEGGAPGTSYPNHIHSGSCETPGGVAAPLTSVAVGTDSTGTATTTVAASVIADNGDGGGGMEQDGGDWLVQVHQPGGTPAACAEIS